MRRRSIQAVAIGVSFLGFLWAHKSALADYVVAWGRNTYGQCDVPPGGDFVAVAAGDGHSLALKSDRSLVAWGYGECEVPKGNDFVAITAYGPYRIALRSNSSLVGWGQHKDDRCDVPKGKGFVAVAAGETSALGLKSDGSLIQWDYKGNYLRDKPPLGNDFVAIAAGDRHNLALKNDGTAVGWGSNSDGQCDAPDGMTFVAISAGSNNSFGIKPDGSLVTWGYRKKRGTARLPRGNNFVSVASYEFYNMALRSDGSVIVWMSGQGVVSDNFFTAVVPGLDHDLALVRNPQSYANRQRPFRRRPTKSGSPVAEDIAVTTAEDSEVQIKLVGQDPDGDDINYYVSNRPMYGKLSENKGEPDITYTPYVNYYGLDRFTFYLRDAGKLQSNYATVDIAVTAVPDKPIAQNINVSACEATPVEIDLLGVDYDADFLTYAIESQPDNGKLELVDATYDIYLYTPNPDFRGDDHFTFTANDGMTRSDLGSVNITVFPSMFKLSYNRDEEVCAVPIVEPLRIENPVDLAVDPQGNLYVLSASPGQSKVIVCDDQLQVTRTITIEADNPKGLALGQERFYITDTSRNRILRYTNGGNLDPSFGTNGVVGRFGTGEGEFNQPWGIAVDRDGNVYVSDAGNNRIQIFDSQGHFRSQWYQTTDYDHRFSYSPQADRYGLDDEAARVGPPPRGITHVGQTRAADRQPLNQPTGFYLSPSGIGGEIFLADTGNNRVKRLSSSSGYLYAGMGGKGSDRGQFNSPIDTYYDLEFDQLVVADAGNNRIQLFQLHSYGEFFKTNEMTYLQEIADQNFSNPMAVATASEETRQFIYVADTGNDRVLKLENNIEIPRKITREQEVAGPIDSNITIVTRETSLVKFGEGRPIRADAVVSPDNRRVAYIQFEARSSGRVVVNGVPGKLYDVFSGVDCVFSPDSQRLAYVAGQKGRKLFVVLDGAEGTDGYTGIGNLTFSPDSQRFAYKAWDNDARKYFVFLDGKKSKPYDGIKRPLVFSPDSKRLAFAASLGGKKLVVVDGSDGRGYDSILAGPLFSTDGKHVTYTAKCNEKGVIVRDEVEKGEFGGFGFSLLSPYSKRMAYISENVGKKRVVLDGKPGKQYDNVTKLKFCPDGKRFAYLAWDDDRMCVVVDGREQQFYEWADNITFSPDCKHLAYSAGAIGKYIEQFVVVDGIESKRHKSQDAYAIFNISPSLFSPDGRHIAYVVEIKDKSWVVVDEVEGRHYDEIRKETVGGWNKWDKSLAFSPNGRIAYWAKRDNKWRVVVDGVESKEYWGYLPKSKLFFKGPNLLHAVAFQGREIFHIELEITER